MAKQEPSSTAKKIAIGAALAATAGYVAGLLTAPQSGKQTRKDIKDTTNKGISDIERELKKLHTELADLIGDVKDKSGDLKGKSAKEMEDLVESARNAKQKARELLSAIHEGDAEDKELKKAVDDANKAIEHLRSYLKK